MSGIEIAGIVLGALPLMIAAMEYVEDTRKAPAVWWKIRRAHRKDLSRLRTCEVQFQMHMNELLLPLRMDGTISHKEHTVMLSSPDNASWKRLDVQEALVERLSDCCEQYLRVLQELNLTLTQLADVTMVHDEGFQARVHERRDVRASNFELP